MERGETRPCPSLSSNNPCHKEVLEGELGWYCTDMNRPHTCTSRQYLHSSGVARSFQPEAFRETSGPATILPGNATKGLTMVSFQKEEEGGKKKTNKQKKKENKNPRTTKLFYHGPMFTKYFAGKKTKQDPTSSVTTSVR